MPPESDDRGFAGCLNGQGPSSPTQGRRKSDLKLELGLWPSPKRARCYEAQRLMGKGLMIPLGKILVKGVREEFANLLLAFASDRR